MPANKAHFRGRSTDASNSTVQWQVVYTVPGEEEPHVDVTHTIQFTVTHGGSSKTYQTDITNYCVDTSFHEDAFPEATERPQTSFTIHPGDDAGTVARALQSAWHHSNPSASVAGDDVTFKLTGAGTIDGQNYSTDGGSTWHPVQPSFSTVVAGMQVDNV